MYYFASDTHFGLDGAHSRQRERLFVRWLDEVSADAQAIFLVGDIFDFWYEYKRVVPKGFTRLLGKLSELTDRGVEIHFFAGNHDLWNFSYLEEECGVILHQHSEVMELAGKRVFIAHGDLLGPRGCKDRFFSGLFRSRVAQWFFSRLVHPDAAMRFGQRWSRSSRQSKPVAVRFRGEEEGIVRFAREYLKTHDVDLFVCGHIHCAKVYGLGYGRQIAFLGEWIRSTTYGTLGPESFRIESYKTDDDEAIS